MRVRVGCEFQFESVHPVTTVMLVGTRADGAHRTIYEVILHLYQSSEPADFITIRTPTRDRQVTGHC